MKASETTFQPIIEGTKQYVVPLFQRTYSWTKKEWDMLWDDLIWLCENSEPKNHFIGSIVTMPTVSVPEGVAKYLLIDGQQRLTTIFILLALLRDLSNRTGKDELALEIQQTMLVNPFKRDGDYLKLLPTQTDRDLFNNLIHQKPIDEQSPISLCYQFFERKIKQNKVDIATLNKVITSRLSAVSIVLDLDDNPHLVFESLNAKGRTLTQSDLIRNYFFMRIHVSEQEKFHTQYWEPMQKALAESLTEFIRHYLMRNGSFVKQNEVYFTIKDRIGQSDAVAALKDIATFANYYEKLLYPEKEEDPQLQRVLYRLNRLQITTAYPFLLSCYHEFAQKQLSTTDFHQILQNIENFVIHRYVCNIPTSQLNKIFPLLYSQSQLKNPSNLADGVRQVLQTRGYPKDIEFHTRLIDARLYGAGERIIKTKFILESLEIAYQHKESPNFNNLTIEHVMPQTITGSDTNSQWWQHHLGSDWQVDHELFLNTLGNLTLTAYNSELSNAPLPKKWQHFANSHLVLNRYFQDIPEWTRKQIETRSKILADLALQVWPYFGEEEFQTSNIENVTGKTPKSVTILGQNIPVESWRDVQSQTLMTIADLEPELFSTLANEYPRFISTEAGRFRRNRQLSNGYYIEVNLSAKDVYHFCSQAIESIGLTSEDWIVDTE